MLQEMSLWKSQWIFHFTVWSHMSVFSTLRVLLFPQSFLKYCSKYNAILRVIFWPDFSIHVTLGYFNCKYSNTQFSNILPRRTVHVTDTLQKSFTNVGNHHIPLNDTDQGTKKITLLKILDPNHAKKAGALLWHNEPKLPTCWPNNHEMIHT